MTKTNKYKTTQNRYLKKYIQILILRPTAQVWYNPLYENKSITNITG